jgi:hypothetical protein
MEIVIANPDVFLAGSAYSQEHLADITEAALHIAANDFRDAWGDANDLWEGYARENVPAIMAGIVTGSIFTGRQDLDLSVLKDRFGLKVPEVAAV